MLSKLFMFFILSVSIFYAQTNVDLVGQLNPYPNLDYADIWGYAAPDGREYALMGVTGGTINHLKFLSALTWCFMLNWLGFIKMILV